MSSYNRSEHVTVTISCLDLVISYEYHLILKSNSHVVDKSQVFNFKGDEDCVFNAAEFEGKINYSSTISAIQTQY